MMLPSYPWRSNLCTSGLTIRRWLNLGHHVLLKHNDRHFKFVVSRFTKVNKEPHQTWSWHFIIEFKSENLHSRNVICKRSSVETKPNRPHISSDTINFKEPETKNFSSASGFPWRARRSFISMSPSVSLSA